MLVTAPSRTVSILMTARPCVLIKALRPSTSRTGSVPARYVRKYATAGSMMLSVAPTRYSRSRQNIWHTARITTENPTSRGRQLPRISSAPSRSPPPSLMAANAEPPAPIMVPKADTIIISGRHTPRAPRERTPSSPGRLPMYMRSTIL